MCWYYAGEVTVCAERVVLQEALPLAQRETGFSHSDWSYTHSGQQLVQEPASEGQSCSGPQRVREPTGSLFDLLRIFDLFFFLNRNILRVDIQHQACLVR